MPSVFHVGRCTLGTFDLCTKLSLYVVQVGPSKSVSWILHAEGVRASRASSLCCFYFSLSSSQTLSAVQEMLIPNLLWFPNCVSRARVLHHDGWSIREGRFSLSRSVECRGGSTRVLPFQVIVIGSCITVVHSQIGVAAKTFSSDGVLHGPGSIDCMGLL
ncbi:unnamed protein product [Hapterophycus canaliculatus]